MTEHTIRSGYLEVAETPRLRSLALLLSDAVDGTKEVRELLGWILTHCPEIQGSLQELEDLRELYGLEPTAAGLAHALQLRAVVSLALGPQWDATEILLDEPSQYPEHALTTASEAVFGSDIADVVPLEEILVALDKTDPETHESRRAALGEHLRERYEGVGGSAAQR